MGSTSGGQLVTYKIFRQGEPPSQRDLQTLMDQSVIVCTSTSRPYAPHEGMLIYEIDTNFYKWYNGSVWAALGSAIDAWISGNNLSVPGNISAGGDATFSGETTTASLAATGDITFRGSIPNRTVDGKIGTGSTQTGVAGTTNTVIGAANAQNTPQIAGRVYRASGQISIMTTAAGLRAGLKLWNGSVGGTQLGGDSNVRTDGASNFRSYQFCFVWSAPTTETIANVNMSIAKLDATSGTVTAQVDGNYILIIEELGMASAIGGL